MRQFKTIYAFETKGYLKNKAFRVVTILLMILILGLLFFPRVKSMISSGGDDKVKTSQIAIVTENGIDSELAKKVLSEDGQFAGNEIVVAESLDKLKEGVKNGTYVSGYAIKDLTHYTFYIENMSVDNANQGNINSSMKQIGLESMLKEHGVSDDQIEKAVPKEIENSVEILGENQAQGYVYTYLMVFALFYIIMMYGQTVATSVASEKSSRAMEVLITSAKPSALMFGKVLASCTAGLLQLVLILGSAYAGYQINASYWTDVPMIKFAFDIPLQFLLYLLVFFLLGFLIYAVMYGAVGSMASKVEDITALSTPIIILFAIAFVIVLTGIRGDVNSTTMVVASYVPFTSPIAMFARIVMGGAVWYEILISIAILAVSAVAIAIYSARIYRNGVLHYGKTPSFTKILGQAKNSQ